jgi:hypothetical protein
VQKIRKKQSRKRKEKNGGEEYQHTYYWFFFLELVGARALLGPHAALSLFEAAVYHIWSTSVL